MANEIGFGTLGTGANNFNGRGWLPLTGLYTAPAGASVKNLKVHADRSGADPSSDVTVVVIEMTGQSVIGMGTVTVNDTTPQWREVAVDIPLTEGVQYGVSVYTTSTAYVSKATGVGGNESERTSSWSPSPPEIGTVLTGDGTEYITALAIAADVEIADPTPIIRKSSTFDIETTLGTITTATLNAVNVFDHVTGQAGTTVSFAGAATDEITTSGEYTLTLGDGTGTEDITVQVNVVGLASFNINKDGADQGSLTDVEFIILTGAAGSRAINQQITGITTTAGGDTGAIEITDAALDVDDTITVVQQSPTVGGGLVHTATLELI